MFDIKKYERLVKIDLTESERAVITDTAGMLIKSFDELSMVCTENVEPLVSVLDIENVFREDVIEKTISREEMLSSAPEQYDIIMNFVMAII